MKENKMIYVCTIQVKNIQQDSRHYTINFSGYVYFFDHLVNKITHTVYV